MRFGSNRWLSKLIGTRRRSGELVGLFMRTPTKRSESAKPTLAAVTTFGSNPGRLLMKSFVPRVLPKNPALVVVLHGCGQSPESLDGAAGFSKLARERGFVLLFPEQRWGNNPQRCFNWFRPSAVARDRGELMSIRQMVDHVVARNHIDKKRIFVAGLSAGGAMTAALVATYPALFAGAAIIAGMPFGSARDAVSAFRAMKAGAKAPPDGWGEPIKAITSGHAEWPPISIWQGTSDSVVSARNADASVDQWLSVHDIPRDNVRADKTTWGVLQSWRVAGRVAVSLYTINGMGHGLPIRPRAGSKAGSGDPHVLPADISAPVELMRLWGLRRR